eukprot:TRINITY_DN1133_c0_g2_i3.p1 TRINITY_DN1133_c0_g2~~TRINITY_DN1133_c0_g2_i3.p1  ORF type:complete len:213 (-),score=16.95 TRINITY_DN1133_c0_g2_i3:103-741(-)
MQRQRHSPQIERKAQGMFRAGLLLDLYVHASFYNHSIAVAKHPWRFILISLLLVSIPFPFLANFEMSNSISTILREDDQGSKRLGDIFGFDEWLDIYVTDAENTGVDESIQKGNQWSKSAFNFMWKAKEMVLKSSFEFQGSTQTFGEICVPFPARNLQLYVDFAFTCSRASDDIAGTQSLSPPFFLSFFLFFRFLCTTRVILSFSHRHINAG